MEDLVISPARLEDAAEIAGLYAHHVLHGTASWELVPPDEAEMRARLKKVLGHGWPWLVARDATGALLGYAYAAQYNPRAGYLYSAENSIYLRHDMLGRGIGSRLLAALLEQAEVCGFRQVIAGIAGNQPASQALHARFGFIEVGRLKAMGRKHGQWLDVIYMQRSLGEGDSTPPEREP